MRKVEREVYLKSPRYSLDAHLENMQISAKVFIGECRTENPLVEYRSESQKLFDGLERNLREQVLKIILTLTLRSRQHQAYRRGGIRHWTTKMAESATERGVHESARATKT